jgi:hypothetical protein
MLVLDRIQGGDLVTAYRLLRVIVASAHLATPGADREYGPFGFSLVGILHVSVLDECLNSLLQCLHRGIMPCCLSAQLVHTNVRAIWSW